MFTKTKLALAAAMIFGVASAALAESGEETGGYQVQSWQEIQHMNQATGTFGGNAYGSALSSEKRGASQNKTLRNDD